jgi:hypothetical protein
VNANLLTFFKRKAPAAVSVTLLAAPAEIEPVPQIQPAPLIG